MKKIFIILLTIFCTTILANINEKKNVSIQFMWLDQYEFAGFYVAKEKGYYKEVGLEVEFHKFTNDTNIVNRVMSGKSDFGTNSTSLLVDKSKGSDIVLLGTVFQSSPLILLALKNSNINTIEDIKNKNVMLTKDQQRFATLQSMLASKNVTINDIKVIKHTFDVDDLINKKADLMLAYTTNEPFILKEKGYESKIFHPKDYGFNFYEEFIFTSKEFTEKNPNTVRNFYDATIKGWEYAFENITEVAQLVYDKYNVQNKSLESLLFEAEEMKKLVYDRDKKIGPITKERIRLIENSYRIMGLLDEDLDIDDLVYDKHILRDSKFTKKEIEYLKNKKEITMCIDPDWMPFEKNENGKHIGISSDYKKIVENKINVPIKVIHTKNWSQSLEFGKKRKCDIFSLVMSTPKREKFLNFTKPYIVSPLVLASNLDSVFVDSINQIKNKKLAIVKDYAYGEILRIQYPNINFIEVSNIHEGLEKIKKGEIFGYIGALSAVAFEIQKDYIGQLKISGRLNETLELGFGVRNDEPILIPILNKAIDSIKVEDKQKILNKWISVNFQKGVDYILLTKIVFIILVIFILIVMLYRQSLLKKLNRDLNDKVKQETEKNIKQNEILNQQIKMASMGEMLGNIAHQWRQPLNVISLAATSLKFRKEFGELSDKEFVEALDSINNTTQFLSKTIDDFRGFLSQETIPNNFELARAINKAIDLTGAQFTNNEIKIITKITNIELFALENELIQVLINILNNAKDAFDDKEEEKYIFIETKIIDDNVKIHIKDNAGGVDENIIHKVFEPYFTTKHQSQGTGIGLYMSEEIITKHMNGTLEVENSSFLYNNKLLTGAHFIISFPISKPIIKSFSNEKLDIIAKN